VRKPCKGIQYYITLCQSVSNGSRDKMIHLRWWALQIHQMIAHLFKWFSPCCFCGTHKLMCKNIVFMPENWGSKDISSYKHFSKQGSCKIAWLDSEVLGIPMVFM
jgi:hypothetical protein